MGYLDGLLNYVGGAILEEILGDTILPKDTLQDVPLLVQIRLEKCIVEEGGVGLGVPWRVGALDRADDALRRGRDGALFV